MRNFPYRLAFFLLPSLLASPAASATPPNFNAYYQSTARAKRATTPSTRTLVSSVDTRRGVPTFSWASSPAPVAPSSVPRSAEATARFFLQERAGLYRLDAQTVTRATVRHVHDTGRGGIVVTFKQRIGGVDVFRNDCKVLLNRKLELVAIGGNLHKDTQQQPPTFAISAANAITKAFADLYDVTLPVSDLIGERQAAGEYREFDLDPSRATQSDKLKFITPARAKKVLFPLPDTLVPAYYLEIDAGRTDENHSHLYGYVIAANDGRVLFRQNLTHSEQHSYRVFADDERLLGGGGRIDEAQRLE